MAETTKTRTKAPAPAAPAPPQGQQPLTEAPKPEPPTLPTEKTTTSSKLEEKMIVIYGPPGVGKSTLASQWADGQLFFFNCAGELGDLEVYQQAITSWAEFREWAWAISESVKKGGVPYKGAAIDTADVLGRYCAETVRRRLNIAHESDLEYGKGWQALRDEFAVNIAKLIALPGFGIVFVAHSDDKTVKTRSQEYEKAQIRGVKSVRETMQDMADLILFVDYSEQDSSQRVIKTKPDRHWDAKERGKSPRLPAEIVWPIGENGWDIIKKAWEGK